MIQEQSASPARVLYWAEATAEGGRAGHARSSDGRLDVDLAVPPEMGGKHGEVGTNPEQLFAAGYSACFQSSLFAVGAQHDLTDSRVTARVGLGPTGHGGFGLTVSLDLHAPHLTRPDAVGLMARAHQRCPYSNATRGNIDVTLLVDGTPITD
jgi:Ohr subfamily peroxiredoxin